MSSDPVLLPPEPAPNPQPPTVRKVFVGQEGLRAGWSALLFILLFATVAFVAFFSFQKLHWISLPAKGLSEISLSFGFINEGIQVFAVLLATWIMFKVEHQGRSYGYGSAQKLRLFSMGLVSGLVLISLLVFTLWKGGFLVIEGRVIFGADVFRYGALWFVGFGFVGVFEESLMRGFLLFTLTRGFAALYRRIFKTCYNVALGFWTAAAILSIIFFLGHTTNPGESPVGLLSVFLAGMFFCLSIWRTGSLWWAIGMHAAWDWGQSFLFGVADSGIMVQHHLLATHPQGTPLFSGGTTGPEGSIFILGVLAVGSAVIIPFLPRGRYYDPPAVVEEYPQPATAVA